MNFEIPEKDVKDANKHKCVKHLFRKNKRRTLEYCFVPTGIGNGIRVKCSCGWEKDYTDYDTW